MKSNRKPRKDPLPGPAPRKARSAWLLLLVPLFLLLWKFVLPGTRRSPVQDDAQRVRALVDAEETALKIMPSLAGLSQGLLHLRLPGPEATNLFASSVSVIDLSPAPAAAPVAGASVEARAWPLEKTARSVNQLDLWRPLLDSVASFEHARLFLLDGDHPDSDRYQYVSNVGFEALARMKNGEWRSLHGTLQIGWARTQSEPTWRIARWITRELQYRSSSVRLFTEVLDQALRSPQEVARLRHSPHYEATLNFYRNGMKSPPHPYFAAISVNQKEGLAVADVDGDGFDDIYITMRVGTNMFLHNNRDGTFTEQAAARGLALPGHTTCALFADFDNDGDLDVMLGRSLLRTAYLENRGGLFFQRPSPKHFPMAVISMSAADYNRDGLLDVYLCTYRPAATAGSSPSGGVAQVDESAFDWPDEFLSPEQAKEFRQRTSQAKQKAGADNLFPDLFDQLGPPNVLLVNRGRGWFEVAPENGSVGLWRNSLQATWGDYDQDGDPDLYVANDWAHDNLLRNDGAAGFSEQSTAMGLTSYGFAMGASWGDYDNDGREDLYVSNMYSEAGRRIIARLPEMNPSFAESASGNWLYHQEADGRFQQVGGLKAPALTVMNAGWSWGGCFTDFDNDTFLDLYVLSGYFSAPRELASDLELESNLWRTTVRADPNLARASLRFSPEWKRTSAPDNQGPEIDSRLGGVERRGDRVSVHSLNGHERNHYFANLGGRAFADISPLSGLDNPADSRGFAVLDYDRDGWADVALVNANQPLFNLYHNDMQAAGIQAGVIALRFVGGNRTSSPSQVYSCRDGYGARVTVDLGDTKLIREHRCGDGWSTQNSATMLIGIGRRTSAVSITVKWPSGKSTVLPSLPEGSLATVYENPADSPSSSPFLTAPYRVKSRAETSPGADRNPAPRAR